ncbi:heterokaryon incompatibility protein-domain-containing protein [Microdochium bolleyi]|uniref:Heterokaryon incompatibility protein-domain-containing protein n=1 Tax=Microdochium bolleyi TaxID=196109 RepID=A0A136J8N2_9PEZI|nr:heterokaryon incompatibility protein-domain-containing protein [Microdochium bolleyi]
MASDDPLAPAQPLCQYCAAIFPIKPSKSFLDIKHYATAGDLVRASATTRCALCAAIQQHWPLPEIRERFPQDTEEQILEAELDLQLRHGQHGGDRSGSESPGDEVSWVTLSGYLASKRHNFSHTVWLVIAACPASSPTSPAIWKVPAGATTSIPQKHLAIKSWLSDCERNHEHCRRLPVDSLVLPKRLVRIDPQDEGGLRLVLASDERRHGDIRYAALSHCWGTHLPVRTTTANLAQMGCSIPPMDDNTTAELPRTFREAIGVCRHVGLGYIWIDSLCIVQDDPEEWRVEAARMKDVYSNAWLTIAASSAESSAKGCFVSWSPDEDKVKDRGIYRITRFDTVVDVSNSVEKVDSDPLLPGQKFTVRVYKQDLGRRSANTALSERGWALQEQVLSRRVVHCTWPELHWQCSSAYQTEAGISLPRHSSDDKHIRLISEPHSTNDPTHNGSMRGQQQHRDPAAAAMHDSWCQWMEHYSTRDFSFQRDQLTALAGMVQQTAENTGYTHILGCWEETICTDLAWCGDRNCFTPAQRQANVLPGIPSWSWISRTKDIELDLWIRSAGGNCRIEDCAVLLGRKIVWQGAPLVSELRRAELQLRGPMREVRFSTVPEARVYDPPYLNIGDDIRRASAKDPIPWDCAGGFDEPQSPGGDDSLSNGGGEFLDGTYTCLLLRRTVPRVGANVRSHETFLILQLVSGRDVCQSPLDYDTVGTSAGLPEGLCLPVYRRIGIGDMRTDQGRYTYADESAAAKQTACPTRSHCQGPLEMLPQGALLMVP